MIVRTYYLLTKPGIIFGNLVTTLAGFCLASQGDFNLNLFLTVFAGLGLVIASACVFNNYIDRDLDKKMERTNKRALAAGSISGKKALLFALALGFTGLCLLTFFTNALSASIASLGFLIYVGLYSFWKTKSALATLIGSISGALPPVIGYTSVSNELDMGALLLFTLLVVWQMPHFFSIGLYRFEDYKRAEIPILPVKKGSYVTKVQMVWYITSFIVTTLLLAIFGYVDFPFLLVSLPLAIFWLGLSLKGFDVENDQLWAKNMFKVSLVIIMAQSFLISFKNLFQ